MSSILLSIVTILSSWQFAFEKNDFQMPARDDIAWHAVTIPHDYAITGPFDRANDLQETAITQNGSEAVSTRTGRTGGLPYVGKAWYKTHLTIKKQSLDNGNRFTLLVDGAMAEARVYVNGKEVEFWPYGYATFYVDLTSFLLPGDNELAIRVENLPESSRWYPGAGLYRNVRLIESPRTHLAMWSTRIWTKEVRENGQAIIGISGQIESPVEKGVRLKVEVSLGADNYYVRTRTFKTGEKTFEHEAIIPYAHLWSPESPNLYYVRYTLYEGNSEVEQHIDTFGIRTVETVANKGFFLNGKLRKFKGVCLHHDLGPLGTAVYEDAIRYQIRLLKDMGCDAIRTSHNMPAPELVRLCDEMGMMLVVEPFDEWDWGKCKNGYHRYFNTIEEGESLTWAERDMTNMLRHYRNHPSVVMWSIGNEVPTQCAPDGAKTAQMLVDICKREDPTRPVTAGMDQVSCVLDNGFAQTLDVVGLNYRTFRYQEAFERTPQKMVLGSETASTVSSRGEYHIPAEKNNNATICNTPQPNGTSHTNQCSSYDLEYCPWSNLPDEDFALQDDYPWTMGQFVWTGFDYLGEPSPYDTDAWPSHSSYFGIIDLASIPKDRYYLYRSQWNTRSHTLHILPHWNWKEGDTIPVFVYTDMPQAELFLNGESLGTQHKLSREEAALDTIWGVQRRYRLMWQVPYKTGRLEARAYDKDGKMVKVAYMRTAEDPFYIELVPTTIGKLTYVRIRVLDINNTLCPNADNEVELRLTGTGKLLGAANGDPTCLIPFQSTKQRAFHGELTAIIEGSATLEVTSKGIKSGKATIVPTNNK